MRQKLTSEQRDSFATEYSAGASLRDLCKKYGLSCHKSARHLVVSRGGILRKCGRYRTHSLDESAFESITSESAYWIGFLMADGCVTTSSVGNLEGIQVFLAKKDSTHLRKLRKFLKSTAPIKSLVLNDKRKGWENVQSQEYLMVYSKSLAESLARFGVSPRKSHTAKVVGLEFNRDFWRGVVDGDGYLSIVYRRDRSKPAPMIGLVGSGSLLEQFRQFIEANTDAPASKIQSMGSIFSLRFTGKSAIVVARLLYKDCAVALARKLATAKAFMSM